MPALRSPIRSPFKRVLRTPFDYSGVAAVAPTPPGSPTAWHTAYDRTYMTVNSDGSGGIPASGGTVGRITDRTGNGWHLIQATAANRAIARDGYLGMSNAGFNGNSRFYATASAPSGDKQASTGLLVMDSQLLQTWAIPFTWTNGLATAARYPSKRVYMAWRASATAFDIWINGVQYSAAALTAGAVSALALGATLFYGAFYENLYYGSALNDTDFAALRAYGATRSGSATNTADVLWSTGDSITQAFGSKNGVSITNLISKVPNYTHYNDGTNGRLAQNSVTGANAVKYRSAGGRTIAIVEIGVNDLHAGTTAAQTEIYIADICRKIRNSGIYVIVCTICYSTPYVADATTDACNALIRANALADYADRICDVAARAELASPLSATYTQDGLHLNDAGLAVWANELDKTIATMDADFTQTSLSAVTGASVTLTDTSINGPTTWSWAIDGGAPVSTAQNPTISFPSAGTHTLTLTITNAGGTATRTKNFAIVAALAPVTANKAFWFVKGDAAGATWTDTSGNARNMTFTGSPSISAGVVTFAGSQKGKLTAFTFNEPVTIYLRIRPTSWASGREIIDGDTNASALLWQTGTTPSIDFYVGGPAAAQNSALTVAAWHSLCIGRRISNVETIIDVDGTMTSSTALQGNYGGFTLAAQGGGFGTGRFDVTEIIGYSVSHTDAERAQTLAYLNSK